VGQRPLLEETLDCPSGQRGSRGTGEPGASGSRSSLENREPANMAEKDDERRHWRHKIQVMGASVIMHTLVGKLWIH